MKVRSALLACAGAVLMHCESSVVAQAQRSGDGIIELGAAETVAAIAAGKIKSLDLVNALIARADEKANLNSIITMNSDRARKLASTLDAEAQAGRLRGALHGLPIVVKDNIDAEGLPTTAGTPALAHFVPAANAPVLQKLIDAGAIPLAKTNMHELAFGITSNNSRFGAVGNAYNAEYFAGGSSGGTAAAVAARLAAAGLGTDTGGSVRIPAALNGITGFRPTTGRYPTSGIVPLSHTRDTPGPMARSVADLVLLDTVITDASDEVGAASLRGVRLGVSQSQLADLQPATKRIFDATVQKLKAAGAEIVEADMPEFAKLTGPLGFTIVLYEARRELPAFLVDHSANVRFEDLASAVASADVKGALGAMLGPKAITDSAYGEAIGLKRPLLQEVFARYFAENRLDAMIFPTTPLTARPIKGHDETIDLNGRAVPTFPTYIRMTDADSIAGIPGLTIPAGLSDERLPVGIEFDGPAGSDRHLLAIGLAAEQVLGRLPPP